MKWDIKTAFKKYQVNDCRTLEEFLDKYYKHDRYKGRGEEYAQCLLQSHKRDFREYGVDWISKHESVTGRVVSFYASSTCNTEESHLRRLVSVREIEGVVSRGMLMFERMKRMSGDMVKIAFLFFATDLLRKSFIYYFYFIKGNNYGLYRFCLGTKDLKSSVPL